VIKNPLYQIKSIQFNESTILYIGSIKFTIEEEKVKVLRVAKLILSVGPQKALITNLS
jgi:hypothetical protein